MEWWRWWSREFVYARTSDPRVLLKIELQAGIRKTVKDGVVLCDMAEVRNREFLTAIIIAATYQRLTNVFVLTLLRLSRIRLTRCELSEGDVV